MTIVRLWESPALETGGLPAALQEFYDGGLLLPPRCVYANFVETLDGVVAIPGLDRSNALVADGSSDDKRLMGLLRALADAILIGTGTMLASPRGRWRPEGVDPDCADAFASLRRLRGKPERATVAVVTSGASLDAGHPVLADGAIVLTTTRGAAALEGIDAEVVAVNDGHLVDLAAALGVLRARGFEQVLAEAGPRTFGALLAAGLVDELFLTISPVLAGRRDAPRLGLVEGVELAPGTRVGATLESLRRGGEHLFARYGIR